MYRYKKKALIKDFLSLLLMLFLTLFAVYNKSYYWATFGGVLSLLLVKDFYKIYRLELVANSEGLYEKTGESMRKVFDWKQLTYVTRTKKFNKFVVLADDDRNYYYLKPSLEGRESLLKEIIGYNMKNKNLQIDAQINIDFQLNLHLNEEGNIRSK